MIMNAGTVTVDLKAAGLTHASGKSDKCDGSHVIGFEAVTDVDDPESVTADGLAAVLQSLHEQAHPRGCAYRVNCREPGCREANELTEGYT
jgi:hypothetical protein